MMETVWNVAVVVARILHNSVQVVLVVYLGRTWIKVLSESWVLLELFLADFDIADDLFRLEDTDSSLRDIEIKSWSGLLSNGWLVSFPVVDRANHSWLYIKWKASCLGRHWVQATIVVVANLGKVGHGLRQFLWAVESGMSDFNCRLA